MVRHRETLAVAMPRGSGKTMLCQVAVVWAIIIASTEGNVSVPERDEKVGLNVYRKKP